ncbi:MAG: DEAD/DEAH box helicase [Candidatus Promineifilaceae bacterium]
MRGIQDAGYQTPTPIQQQAIPEVISGRDVLGLAQTGTGKTAAFMLPVLQRLTRGKLRKIRVLVVAPTRELAEQIHVSAEGLAKYTKIRSMTMYGGVGKGKQRESLRRGVEIIVACPGRFLDMHREEGLDMSNVEVLILDEADRMCDMGFLPDIKRICKLLPDKRQTLFFSATMPTEIRQLTRSILRDPITVQIGMIAPAKTVSHAIFKVPDGTKVKRALLLHILENEPTGRVLVFTRTKRRAKVLAQKLERQKYSVAALQGNMSQNARQRAIDGYRSGKFSILVATDIAARGIDVSDISHVINFDMPDTVDAYTHRIGRTGRAKQSGDAYTFVTHDDSDMLRSIERLLKQKVNELPLPDGLLENLAVEEYIEPAPRPVRPQSRHGGRRLKSTQKVKDNTDKSSTNGKSNAPRADQPKPASKRRRSRRRSSGNKGQQPSAPNTNRGRR